MIARVLDYEEWSTVPEYMDAVMVALRPETSRVCVVENEHGEIVARWLLYPVLFAEDLWIHPDYRKQISVGRKLWRLVHRCANELGFNRAVSTVVDGGMDAYLAHPKLHAEEMPRMVTYPVGAERWR